MGWSIRHPIEGVQLAGEPGPDLGRPYVEEDEELEARVGVVEVEVRGHEVLRVVNDRGPVDYVEGVPAPGAAARRSRP